MAARGKDKDLDNRLDSGEYVIDEHAVAEAMLNRLARGELPRSAMLIAGESLYGGPVRRDEDGTPPGAGLA
jgi:hypothetical protein